MRYSASSIQDLKQSGALKVYGVAFQPITGRHAPAETSVRMSALRRVVSQRLTSLLRAGKTQPVMGVGTDAPTVEAVSALVAGPVFKTGETW